MVYLGVMSKKHPSAVPQMLAYMLTIIRVAQEFEDPAWILYDAAYRDKAAATKNRKWSQIDAGLYNLVFTGQARKLRFCKHCSACTHGSEECGESYRKRPNEEQVGGSKMPKMAKSDVCFLFN